MNQKPSVLQVILSTIAAAFGVQSHKNRLRDFEGGRAMHYIIAGILVTLTLIAGIAFTVNFVLQHNATKPLAEPTLSQDFTDY